MLTLGNLSELLDLQLVNGDPDHLVGRVSTVRDARGDALAFIEDESGLVEAFLSNAGGIIAPLGTKTDSTGKTFLLSDQPRLAFAKAAHLLRQIESGGRNHFGERRGIHPTAMIGERVRLGDEVHLGPNVVLGDDVVIGTGTRITAGCVLGAGVQVGKGCHLCANVAIYPGTTLGDGVIVHSGAVLGGDGFGYVRDHRTGEYTQFPQQGTLLIEDDVEIGSNSTIDRGALEETRVGRGTKIDNLVHIGHNVRVGRNVVIAAQTGISGSAVIGDGAVIAGQVGIADHVTIGNDVVLGAQAGVPSHKKIEGPGVVFWGTPARPIRTYLKELAALARISRRSDER